MLRPPEWWTSEALKSNPVKLRADHRAVTLKKERNPLKRLVRLDGGAKDHFEPPPDPWDRKADPNTPKTSVFEAFGP